MNTTKYCGEELHGKRKTIDIINFDEIFAHFIQIVNMCCPFINKKHLCSSITAKCFTVDLVHYKLIRVLSGWNSYETVRVHDILSLFIQMQTFEWSWQKALHWMKFDFYSMNKQCVVVSINSIQCVTLRLWIHRERESMKDAR